MKITVWLGKDYRLSKWNYLNFYKSKPSNGKLSGDAFRWWLDDDILLVVMLIFYHFEINWVGKCLSN